MNLEVKKLQQLKQKGETVLNNLAKTFFTGQNCVSLRDKRRGYSQPWFAPPTIMVPHGGREVVAQLEASIPRAPRTSCGRVASEKQ